MRAAVVVLVLAATVLAGDLERVQRYLDRGKKALAAVGKARSDSKRLRALQKAKPHFNRARKRASKGMKRKKAEQAEVKALGEAERNASLRLVGILNAETILYLRRRAYSQAEKRNAEALKLLPGDATAKDLALNLANLPADEITAHQSDAAFAQAGSLMALLRNRSQAAKRYVTRPGVSSVRSPVR